MKKTYIRPELTAFQMASQYVLAGSPSITNTEYGGGTILAPEQYDIIEIGETD